MPSNVKNASIVLTAIALAVATACSTAVPPGSPTTAADFTSRLQSIVQAASARYGELAGAAAALDPSQPLPEAFKASMRELAEGDRRAADEIASLQPPQHAEDLTNALVAALRARADAFEQAAAETNVSLADLEELPAITTAERQLDAALRSLVDAGLLAEESPHE